MATSQKTNRCTRCSIVKPITEFYSNKSKKYGCSSWCRLCSKAYTSAYKRTEKGSQVQARSNLRYNRSEKGIEDKRKYNMSDKGRLKSRESSKRYQERERLYLVEAFLDRPQRRHFLPDVTSAVVINDLQIPFEDINAVDEALHVIQHVNPDCVVINGDLVDFYALSDFNKDYNVTIRDWPETFKRVSILFNIISQPIHWLFGNHERRMIKHLQRVTEHSGPNGFGPLANAFLGMNHDIDVTNPMSIMSHIFKLKEFPHVTLYPDLHRLYLADGNLIVTHGQYARKHSGDSAKASLEQYGRSVIVGHSHRLGSYLISQDGRDHGAWENGCLCTLDPEYVDAPNWQHGMTVVKINGPEFHTVQIPIVRRGDRLVAIYE